MYVQNQSHLTSQPTSHPASHPKHSLDVRVADWDLSMHQRTHKTQNKLNEINEENQSESS